MRIRSKPWARPELEECSFFVACPKEKKGKWAEEFGNGLPLYLEVGCGKGGFLAQAVLHWSQANFIAIDIKNEMLVLAKRKVEKALAEAEQSEERVRVTIANVSQIGEVFGNGDSIARLFVNFCNPWPRTKHKKRRLTHPRQLVQYLHFLNGELWFKTDDVELFDETLAYLDECHFTLLYQTRDLASEKFPDNLVTEHEQMFMNEGKSIHFLIAAPPKGENT